MSFEQIIYELDGGVLTLTLNRPDRLNAWTGQMGRELMEAFDRADADDEVHAVIVTGAGRGFCAGADLGAGGETFDYRKRGASDPVPRDNGGELTLRIFNSTKPVIAAINGPAVGVGATMTLPMDVRLASERGAHGLRVRPPGDHPGGLLELVPAARGGHQPGDGMGRHGPRVLRPGGARGRARAKRPPPEELLGAARALAQEIAENAAPVSVALARQLMWRMLGAEHPMLAHRADSRGMLARGQSADAVEGITAFLEKRPASFPDHVSAGLPDVMPWWQEPEFS